MSAVTSSKVAVTDTYFWAITAVPVLLAIADLAIGASFSSSVSSGISIILAIGINIALVVADSKQLRAQGIEVNPLIGIVLVPLYLYRRSKLTGRTQAGLLVWVASFIVSFLLSIIGTSFVGSQVSTSGAETAIKDWLISSSIADKSVSVSCPESVLAKPGATFICTADTYPSTTLEVTVKNEQGDITWQVIG
jgi:hypothetical protein